MNLAYGDASTQSDAGVYKFACGNCHPQDTSKPRNGQLDVELYNAAAPAGSLKAKNPSTAAFDPVAKTCADVYCHSGFTVLSSTAVGEPLRSPPEPVPPGHTLNNGYIMDESCSNLTYAPYTVESGREYKTTPPWGTTGTFTRCTECHQFPLTTSFPAVQAGVGDTHQWIDENGWAWLHAWNHSFGPLHCRTCHYSTVTQEGEAEYTDSLVTFEPVPLASRATHVDGKPDVAFDPVNGVVYTGWTKPDTYSLGGATYDPATKTCSSVPCHSDLTADSPRFQQKPKWGQPYRGEWGSAECDQCHRMGLSSTCLPSP